MSTAKLAGEMQDVGTTPRKPLTPRERLAFGSNHDVTFHEPEDGPRPARKRKGKEQ